MLQAVPGTVPVTVTVPAERRALTVALVDVPVRRFTPSHAGTMAVEAATTAAGTTATVARRAVSTAARIAPGIGIRAAGRVLPAARIGTGGTTSSIEGGPAWRSASHLPTAQQDHIGPTRKGYRGASP